MTTKGDAKKSLKQRHHPRGFMGLSPHVKLAVDYSATNKSPQAAEVSIKSPAGDGSLIIETSYSPGYSDRKIVI